MVLYNFNPDSFLNTAVARIINGVLLFFVLAISAASEFYIEVEVQGTTIAIMIMYILGSVRHSIAIVLKKNKWREFDKDEADNKQTFIISYCCFSFLFSTLIALYGASAINCYVNGEQGLIVLMPIIAFLVFNRLNICSLFNFGGYIEGLFPLYGCTELEAIKYVLARKHHIYLDDIISELRELKGLED